MALDPNFPADPYAILHPDVRWYPGQALLDGIGRDKLIPPLVEKVRRERRTRPSWNCFAARAARSKPRQCAGAEGTGEEA